MFCVGTIAYQNLYKDVTTRGAYYPDKSMATPQVSFPDKKDGFINANGRRIRLCICT